MDQIDVERTEKPEAKWYVVHTYSGHEMKVKTTMEKMVKNRGMQNLIEEIAVPMESYTETKDGVDKQKERKMFPSYVLVKMIMTDETWYLVRNTRGVTGFVGPGSDPIPLSDEEVREMGVVEKRKIDYDYKVGDGVKVMNGPFENFMGTIENVNEEREKVKVFISMFGRDTLLELDFDQVEKIG
ncbi:MAG: transcription termination/antitermination protein NusG [Tissierellia bacterium]|nr:transcription termination/antitermination protein NusG [Tissierellia bacterium]